MTGRKRIKDEEKGRISKGPYLQRPAKVERGDDWKSVVESVRAREEGLALSFMLQG